MLLCTQTLTAASIQPAGAITPNGGTAGLPSAAFLSAKSIMKVASTDFWQCRSSCKLQLSLQLYPLYVHLVGCHAQSQRRIFGALLIWCPALRSCGASTSAGVLHRLMRPAFPQSVAGPLDRTRS